MRSGGTFPRRFDIDDDRGEDNLSDAVDDEDDYLRHILVLD
jgi:hypothetical protein